MAMRPGGEGSTLVFTKPIARSADVSVRGLAISADCTAATLTVPIKTYKNGMVCCFNCAGVRDEEGRPLAHSEAWYTVQRVPRR